MVDEIGSVTVRASSAPVNPGDIVEDPDVWGTSGSRVDGVIR